jgi:hypothetical protein
MDNLLSKLHGDEVFVLIVVLSAGVVGLVIAVTAIVMTNWRRVRQLDVEGSLKQDMLQRGMGAEDIERVIRATSVPVEKESKGQAAESFCVAAASPAGLKLLSDKQLEAKVAADLAAYGMDSDELEKALEALGGADTDTKQAVAQAVAHMTENGAEHEQIRAAIVKLCEPSRNCCPNRM